MRFYFLTIFTITLSSLKAESYKIHRLLILLLLIGSLNFALAQGGSSVSLVHVIPYDTCESLKVNGNYLYANNGKKVIIFSLANPALPDSIGSIMTPSVVNWIFPKGNMLFVGNYLAGLTIIDISNPSNPIIIGSWDTNGHTYGIYVKGDYAYIGDYSEGLHIVDVSDPTTPVHVSTTILGSYTVGIDIKGNYAFVANEFNGLKILDVNDVFSPIVIGSFNTNGITVDVKVQDDYAFVCDYYGGLRVLDVSNPILPIEISAFDTTGGDASGLCIKDSLLYLAYGDLGLRIFNINNPDSLLTVGRYDTDGRSRQVDIFSNYIYLADINGGLKVFLNELIQTNIPVITAFTDSLQGAGTNFWVDVQVGDSLNPVTDLFGVSFSLHYTNTQYIDVVSPYGSNVLPGNFMGSNVVFLPYVDDPNGQIDIGISRQAGQGGVSGYGPVARIQFSADLNTPHNTPVTFTIDNISAIDPNGAPIQLDPQDVTITITSTIVWPGDANNDGTANVADVLPLGLYYNSTGPARPNASMTWTGQICPPGWNPDQAAYADCNGDGVIDVADVLPIGLNYNQTHSKRSSQANWLTFGEEAPIPEIRTTVYDQNMKPTGLNAIANGEPFYIGLTIGKAEHYVGTSFTLDWRNGSSDMGGFTIDRSYGQNGLQIIGDWQPRLLAMNRISETEARCEFGFSLKNYQHSFNDSEVALIRCIRTGNASVPLTITDLVALDWEGRYYQANPMVGIEAKQEPLVIGKDFNLGNYPNPFNPATTIRFALPYSEKVWLTVYNTLGQEVAVLVNGRQLTTGQHEYHFDSSSLANGLYFYRLQVGQQVVTKKMLLMK